MTTATKTGVQSAGEFEGLDDLAQHEIEVHSFRGRLGQPRRAHTMVAGFPETELRQSIARLQTNLASRLGSDPLVAIYISPSKEKSTDGRFFCEACTVGVPAQEQDWQRHSAGVTHQSQILSLCDRGELAHMPEGGLRDLTSIISLQRMARVRTAPADSGFTPHLVFTKQQLHYFRCQDPGRLRRLQAEAMMVMQKAFELVIALHQLHHLSFPSKRPSQPFAG